MKNNSLNICAVLTDARTITAQAKDWTSAYRIAGGWIDDEFYEEGGARIFRVFIGNEYGLSEYNRSEVEEWKPKLEVGP